MRQAEVVAGVVRDRGSIAARLLFGRGTSWGVMQRHFIVNNP
jgi:hypothetical protein